MTKADSTALVEQLRNRCEYAWVGGKQVRVPDALLATAATLLESQAATIAELEGALGVVIEQAEATGMIAIAQTAQAALTKSRRAG